MTETRTSSGTVEFIWEAEDSMLITLEPDDPNLPHTFELHGGLRRRFAAVLTQGDRIEVDFVAVEHEVVDPDGGPSDAHRAEVRDLRVIG